ncbi:HAD domain-containing protein [Flavobacterium sp. CAU 1735]|uniref:HAD domain-containing protein n=1 Tax=Flavobacterium sp. CAU 1735 TaxID=3140361 RepID=UPI00326162F4
MKIFLDIDGVMVHANPQRKVDMAQDGFYQFNTIAVAILNEIIGKVKKVELILSTSHRFRFPILEWIEIFKRRKIYADTISILDIPQEERFSRKTEIVNWMDKCKYSPEEVLIIDDDKSLNGLPQNLKERLLLTNPYIGLNSASYSDLDRILK